jgi:hypothetical protein
MKLQEIDNTSLDFPVSRHGDFLLGVFTYEGKPYVLQLHVRPLQFEELRGLRTAEVSFFRHDIQGDKSYATVDDLDAAPFKVYSVITNRLVDLSADFDAFYFSAEQRHSDDVQQFQKKVRIYRYMSDLFQKRTGWWYYEADNPFRAVVSRIEVHDSIFKNPLEEACRAIDWSQAPEI